MNSNHDTSTSPAATLLDELRALVMQAEAKISQPRIDADPDVLGTMRARFDAAQEQLTGLYAGASKKIAAGAKCTDEAIRSNPYPSIAIAAGIGLLVGVLAGRSSK